MPHFPLTKFRILLSLLELETNSISTAQFDLHLWPCAVNHITAQRLLLLRSWTNKDSGKVSVLVLFELSAAFDIVDHKILRDRLENWFGCPGTVLNWFESHLDDLPACSIQQNVLPLLCRRHTNYISRCIVKFIKDVNDWSFLHQNKDQPEMIVSVSVLSFSHSGFRSQTKPEVVNLHFHLHIKMITKSASCLLSRIKELCHRQISKKKKRKQLAARVLTKTRKVDHITSLLISLHWLPVCHTTDFKMPLLF